MRILVVHVNSRNHSNNKAKDFKIDVFHSMNSWFISRVFLKPATQSILWDFYVRTASKF